jgi:HD-GYP domain-containing protein (c-di-GMP phosphodiesterase class II)
MKKDAQSQDVSQTQPVETPEVHVDLTWPGTNLMLPPGRGRPELAVLSNVARKVSSISEVSRLVAHVMRVVEHILNAAAASVLLVDEDKQELFFEFADGDAGGVLKEVRMSIDSGIAGWVARNGRPLIVNDVRRDPRFYPGVDRATGFMTRSIMCVPLKVHGKVIGAIEVLNKVDGSDFNERDLRAIESVASGAGIAIDNVRLGQELLYGYRNTVKALAAAIDAKDPYTCGHSQRVKEYALIGAHALSLSLADLEAIEYAGILHDVGKIDVDDSILRKPGPLTPDEWVHIRRHPAAGARLVVGLPRLHLARKLVLHHHERYDGRGYPNRLRGEEIPMGSRLLAVADAFDTMTTNRSYRTAVSPQAAIAELRACVATQFCPVAVQAFISGLESRRASSSDYNLPAAPCEGCGQPCGSTVFHPDREQPVP